MSDNLPRCPGAPHWAVDWDALEAECGWLRGLRGCGQDAENHGEGDVATHTRMVCEALASLPAWRGLDEGPRRVLFAAALLHDVAKPATRRVEPDGDVHFPHHARRGAILARAILWRRGVPFGVREQVCALVRHHLKPFFLIEDRDPRRRALEVSQTARSGGLTVPARKVGAIVPSVSTVAFARERGKWWTYAVAGRGRTAIIRDKP